MAERGVTYSGIAKSGKCNRGRRLSCRVRRRKCDGARPHFQNCISRSCTCQWGLRASFHHSRTLSRSRQEIANLQAVETRRKSQISHTIINETNDILLDYLVPEHGGSPCQLHRGDPAVESPDDTVVQTEQQTPRQFPEDDASRPDIAALWHAGGGFSISDLLALSFTAAAPSSVTPLPLARLAPHHDDGAHMETSLIVSNSERLRFISLYIQNTGTWCETTDSDKHFTVQSIHEMIESPAFTAAAMALASRQIDYVDCRERPLTLELYQHTIQLLLRNDTAAPGASVLATCTLLCAYEMMASDVHEWRKHLKGCAGLLQAKKWNGSAPGILKSYDTHPNRFWLDDTSIESVRDQGNIDDYCNLPILIFAKIVNLRSANSADINYNDCSVSAFLASSVWDELQKWYQLRPLEVCPLLEDFPLSKVFPTILLSRSSSSHNTFYHTVCILLLQTGLVATGASGHLSEELYNLEWHARRLVGISISNPSHASWVNQLHPLYIAGTVFTRRIPSSESDDTASCSPLGYRPQTSLSASRGDLNAEKSRSTRFPARGDAEDDYPAENLIILKHLSQIQRETGWKTSNRAEALRALWELG
ncbi:hypothetical protein BDV19DRAFT_399728 [Aspergillus venezuelensis]